MAIMMTWHRQDDSQGAPPQDDKRAFGLSHNFYLVDSPSRFDLLMAVHLLHQYPLLNPH